MIGLTRLEVYNSIFHITEEENKVKVYLFPQSRNGGISYEKFKDQTENEMESTYITATDIQDEILCPNIIEECRKEVSKRKKSDKYMNPLAGYTSSMFQDFESYLRTEVYLVGDDIRLFLGEKKIKFY